MYIPYIIVSNFDSTDLYLGASKKFQMYTSASMCVDSIQSFIHSFILGIYMTTIVVLKKVKSNKVGLP